MREKMDNLTPARVVSELDKYIISQSGAKRAVAIALRNRWRRMQVQGDLRQEIIPNNIIMIGPTGVGKTEIARRIARLIDAPFVKVEASKFTEVGYVGRDVEAMVRELIGYAVAQTRARMVEAEKETARKVAIEKVIDVLLPLRHIDEDSTPEEIERMNRSRDKMRKKVLSGEMDDKEIEIEHSESDNPPFELLPGMSMEILDINFSEMLSNIMPSKPGKKRKSTVANAIKIFTEKEVDRLVTREKVAEAAKKSVEENGIIFIDELDKIANTEKHGGIDVSRSGVQRDLLPIVEGSNVPTKYGNVDTSHILFIAAGAFSMAKPSDLIPELQGRFPIRVELNSLTEDDFVRILSEPENALTKQYVELFKAEGVVLSFTKGAIAEIARFAALANEKMEDIGARRLHTIMNTLLEDYLFEMPDAKIKKVSVCKRFVKDKLDRVIQSEDLSRFIL